VTAAKERLEFAPPRPPGQLRSFGLAVLAHVLLLAALTWGVNWKRQTPTISADAELWAAVPKEAAPKVVEAPPPPEPAPTPKFVAKVTLPPPPPPLPVEAEMPKADIVLAQEKERKRQAQLKALERQEKLKKEKLEKEAAALEKKRQLAEAKQEAQRAEALRQEQMKRTLAQSRATGATGVAGAAVSPPPVTPTPPVTPITPITPVTPVKPSPAPAIAPVIPGATGAAGATGTAAQAAGPSASYGGRIVGRIRPNITFPGDVAGIIGNPGAEVEVRAAADGTILSRKLLKSSGIKAWDEAVLKAIDKTEILPRDIDGRVPSELVISFRPKD
jgi:colicin import membrane protein